MNTIPIKNESLVGEVKKFEENFLNTLVIQTFLSVNSNSI
jgi:hypothetical protein